jgi:lipoate-protein ligase A
MNALRIIDTGLMPARWNVAMTAALVELHSKRGASDLVRFHRYPPCVLIGATQKAERVADLEHCRRNGVDVVPRITGGGAVYMSPAMLAWDVIVDRRASGGPLDTLTRRICGGAAAGLSRLGVKARFRSPNDIAVGGRKISGSSGYAVWESAVLQGTVLLTDETAAMAAALRLPEATLRERTTCLEAEIGATLLLAQVVDAITGGLAEALGREPVPGRSFEAEFALCDLLLKSERGDDACIPAPTIAPT